MRELGWIDGYNLAIEYRWAEGREDRYVSLRPILSAAKSMLLSRGARPLLLPSNKQRR